MGTCSEPSKDVRATTGPKVSSLVTRAVCGTSVSKVGSMKLFGRKKNKKVKISCGLLSRCASRLCGTSGVLTVRCVVWYAECGVWCVVCGVWCVVRCGVWSVVVVCGVWCVVWCGVVCGSK